MVDARLFLVDSFTSVPLAGNPAAVLLLAAAPDDGYGQRVGAELNQPATAVVWPTGEPGHFGLRWFTATAELSLCGHGTLAAARVLLDAGLAEQGAVRFATAAGTLTARAAHDRVELDFPQLIATAADAATTQAVRRIVDVPGCEVLRNDLDAVAVLQTEAQVRAARPDLAALGRLAVRGLIVTARSEGTDADFVSRFFSPSLGTPEDAVTGSAHCCLAPLWIDRLGRQPLLGHQVSARGGYVQVALTGERVTLAGTAVVLSAGSWRLGEPQPAPAS